MEITWLGHSCFRIKGKEAVVITDPFNKDLGCDLGKVTATILTISHNHPGHNYVAGIAGAPRIIHRPGEYEIAETFITGIPTFHDAEGGAKRGKNIVHLMEIDGLRICHLGDLGHMPSSEQSEELSDVDILLVPVGGVSTISAAAAAEIISLLEPKLVIPMHFRTGVARPDLEPVDHFLKEMGLTEISPQPKISVNKSTLPAEIQVVVLNCRLSQLKTSAR